jgi:formylmethanofuran dehydrogenase subunit E
MKQKMKRMEHVNCAGCGMRAPKHLMTEQSGKFYCQSCAKAESMK